MVRYVLVSIGAGVLFGLMDGLINANPLAKRLYAVFAPIARKSMNLAGGVLIDLAYGFLVAGVFILLSASLPGEIGVLKGLAFGVLLWLLRVAMQVGSQWIMFNVPGRTLLYTLACGLGEMLVLGLTCGLLLGPGGTNA